MTSKVSTATAVVPKSSVDPAVAVVAVLCSIIAGV